jgi:hypothetical protein
MIELRGYARSLSYSLHFLAQDAFSRVPPRAPSDPQNWSVSPEISPVITGGVPIFNVFRKLPAGRFIVFGSEPTKNP